MLELEGGRNGKKIIRFPSLERLNCPDRSGQVAGTVGMNWIQGQTTEKTPAIQH